MFWTQSFSPAQNCFRLDLGIDNQKEGDNSYILNNIPQYAILKLAIIQKRNEVITFTLNQRAKGKGKGRLALGNRMRYAGAKGELRKRFA